MKSCRAASFLTCFFLETEFVYIFFFFGSISESEGVDYSTGLMRSEPGLVRPSEERGEEYVKD